MASHFLGIDLGTSSTKALLLASSGRVCATASADHPVLNPRPGWSEQRPADWWTSVQSAVQLVLRRTRVKAGDVAAIGLSGQMHGSVFLDARGKVLCNALLWNDQRTVAECAEIERRANGRRTLIRHTRNVALTGFTAPKLLWLRNHRPRLSARLRTVLLPKDYINYRLTGVRSTDVSDASGTLLFDVAKRRWATHLMHKLDLDPDLFPPAHESSAIIGQLTPTAAKACGLQADIPVIAGAGDQAAAGVGNGIVRPGRVSATLGTSGVVFAHSDQPVPNDQGLLQSFCHAVPGQWCVFGCMLSAGNSLQWAREILYATELAATRTPSQRDRLYSRMLKEAADAPFDARLVFHPYLTGERCPYPHPHARGAWLGLDRTHTRGALLRAVLEGITLGMAAQLDLMRAADITIREIRLAGGGAASPWWRQLQADIYGCRCVTLRSTEGSALGAALLAAVGYGHFSSVSAATSAALDVQHIYRPKHGRTHRYRDFQAYGQSLYTALEPQYRAAALQP